MDELDFYELAQQARAERIYMAQLCSHPDCRDPDHPGCERCCEDEQEESDAQALN